MNISILFSMCLTASFYGTIVGIIICLLSCVLKKQLSATVRFIFWLVPLIRLFVPFAPESRFSLFNLAFRPNENQNSLFVTYNSIDSVQSQATTGAVPVGANIFMVFGIIWICITALLVLWFVVPQIILQIKMKKTKRYDDEKFKKILEECKVKAGIKRNVKMIMQDQIGTPALCGLIHPKILLTMEIEEFSEDYIRYIILHELCHCKRFDVLFGYFLMLVQAIHWFNPFVWYFAYKARQEMELANDEKVMSLMENGEYKEYGRVLIFAAAKFSVYGMGSVLNMASEKSNIKQRIKSIAVFKKQKPIFRAFGVTMILIVGVTCLTNAKLPESITPDGIEHGNSSVRNFEPSQKNSHSENENTDSTTQQSQITLQESNERETPSHSERNENSNKNSVSGDTSQRKTSINNTDISSGNTTPTNDGETINPNYAIVNGGVVVNDPNNISQGGETETTNNANDENNSTQVNANNLPPGTTVDDILTQEKSNGRNPKTYEFTSGINTFDVNSNEDGSVEIYLQSETSDSVSIDIMKGESASDKIFITPRTFNTYTINGLEPNSGYTMKIDSRSNIRVLVY